MKKTSSTTLQSTYVALLRGINLGGHKTIKMDQLRGTLEALGLEDVKTYVQSGNVVFKAPPQAVENLAKRIGEKVFRQFGFSVPVLVRTSGELNEVIKSNPFLKEKGIDASKLHVTFLSRAPEKAALKGLDAIVATPDRFRCWGAEIYLHCPDAYGRTKLSNNAIEKVLAVSATTRNWNTLIRLQQMSLD